MASPQPNPIRPAGYEIVVEGYSIRYSAAFEALMGEEGVLADDPDDRGGTTKYGISLRFLAAEGAFDDDGDGKADFDLDMDGDIDGQDVRRLTRGDAKYLYLRCFWRPVQAETFPLPIGEMLFDQAVNGGISAARKLLQRAVNTCLMDATRHGINAPAGLRIDGAIGPQTRIAISFVQRCPGFGMLALIEAYRDAVRERYRNIATRYPSQKRFLRGWLARAGRLGA